MVDFSKRVQNAVESILDNEAISEGLDDQAAQILLEWGVDLAQKIAASTVELDDRSAEEALAQPLYALRKMLGAARKWALAPEPEHLQKLIAQLPAVYGLESNLSDEQQQIALAEQSGNNPAQRLHLLRSLIEGH